jgi:hypothetical protein
MPVEERGLTSDASSEGTTGREIGLGLINPLTPKRSKSDFTAGRRLMIVCPSVKSVGEPDAGEPPVRFDQREVETEHGMRLLRHIRGNPDPEYVEAYPTAPPLDSTPAHRLSRLYGLVGLGHRAKLILKV